jgi:alginate O-acetyltransferase complex protein AlgF
MSLIGGPLAGWLPIVWATSLANDASLYAPAPPPGSAFVRVLQAGAGAESANVGGVSVGAVQPGADSDYIVVAAGKTDVMLGGNRHAIEVAAQRYYTVAFGDDGPVVFADTPPSARTKAGITVYNLSDIPAVSLQTADGQVQIVADVAPDQHGFRQLNALAVPLRIAGSGGEVMDLGERVLERGAAYSVVVWDGRDGPTARWSTARTRALQ